MMAPRYFAHLGDTSCHSSKCISVHVSPRILICVLLSALFCLSSNLVYALDYVGDHNQDACNPRDPNSLVQIELRRVIDGDSIALRTRYQASDELRIVGLNTPEYGEDFAAAATRHLSEILKQGDLYIELDEDHKDRYNRILGHLWVDSDDGLTSVTALMLMEGLAFHVAVGENIAYIDCYGQIEKDAIAYRRGIWDEVWQDYIVKEGIQAAEVERGFGMVRGEISQVIPKGRNGYELKISNNPVALWIAADFHDNFGGSENIENLLGEKVFARGWIYDFRGNPQIGISHPSMIK